MSKKNRDKYRDRDDRRNFKKDHRDKSQRDEFGIYKEEYYDAARNFSKTSEDAYDTFAKEQKEQNGKHWKDYYESKKKLKKAFINRRMEWFDLSIMWLIRYGYRQSESTGRLRNGLFKVYIDKEFVKILKTYIEDGKMEFKFINFFPMIVHDILSKADNTNKERLANNPNADIYDFSDLAEIARIILDKKIEKWAKKGISKAIAFDILCLIPSCNDKLDCMTFSPFYRIKNFFSILYNHAAIDSEEVPFEKIVEITFKNEAHFENIISFALLERKEKLGKIDDKQKELYLAITNWCYTMMEEKLKKSSVEAILMVYANTRKKDDLNGNDGERRFTASSISETEYPHICKAIREVISDHPDLEKYL